MRGGGIPLDFTRGKTAKAMLEIDWTYPVYKPTTPDRKPGDKTVAQEVERALPIEQAYELVADGDRRPLLILRECEICKGTDHALLSRTLDNEQTVLLTHWFRCVKLPTNVLKGTHPFHALFEKREGEDRVPHLFFADPDGGNRLALPGDQSQSELWNVMFDYLDRCYGESAKEAIKGLRKLLSQYDKLDAEEQLVRGRIDEEIERNGPKSNKLKKFDKQLEKVAKERDKLRKQEQELRDLALRPPVEAPAEGAPGK
ncbi:MAG: hypothetical protein R3F29_03950 [Planctomycetota bacterium]